MTRSIPFMPLAFLSAFLIGLVASPAGLTAQVFASEKAKFRLATVARGLEHPWGLAFLPDGAILVTERPGRLRVIEEGRLLPEPLSGIPEASVGGQGGLLDVALHPDFAENRLVYFSYAGQGPGGRSTEVARARLTGGGGAPYRLDGLETILVTQEKSSGGRHFGSRLAFGDDGSLYVTAGERGSPDRAQDLADHAGSVIRITDEGGVPPDNPFLDRDGARPEIYSYGHRNPQGLVRHPTSGEIWAVEHGPKGGDELNRILPGRNYGWPVITYGRSYAGFAIGEGTAKAGMEQPVTYWVPSISPSGMTFYDAEAFPAWRGNLFVGALSGRALVRLELEEGRVVAEERLLEALGARIRDVRQGPDGLLYLLTDSDDGALLRLAPLD